MELNKTKADYLNLIETLTLPTQAFIDGEFVPSLSGMKFETVNPATGKLITSIASCDHKDVDVAVNAARKSFNSGVWSKKNPSERKEIMLCFADLIEQNLEQLAVLESLESGKPISECLNTDLPETINTIRWHAQAVDKLYDQLAPTGPNNVAMVVREPLGVVACVLPWNFPLMMAAWKIGPALATGNSLIIKPAEDTSMTTLKLGELAHQAGVPAGILNVVPGFGETVGKAIGLHEDVNVISFTGSTEVGRLFLSYSSQSNLKRIVLECGGKNPCVVLEDADLERAAEHAVAGAFWNMGQNCTANSRIIVHHSIKDKLLEKILKQIKQWSTGDPFDPKNVLGSLINQRHYENVVTYINRAVEDGAKLICGGPIQSDVGFFIEPTIFDEVGENMTIAQEEIFGPVTCIMTVGSDDEAIELANRTSYGLQASLYTSNISKAHKYARQLEAGTVSINCFGEGDMSTPFGGHKQSGFGGRDKSIWAHEQYTELKTIWLDVSQ